MQIKDDFQFDDLVTGLKFKVVAGEKLDRLEIENIQGGNCDNRSLWFTKDGDFDGTESRIGEFCPPQETQENTEESMG